MVEKVFHAVSTGDLSELGVKDGVYKGDWSGYYVTMQADDREVKFRTEVGTRGVAPVWVQVKDGKGYVKSCR
jgi:hypothetical protein